MPSSDGNKKSLSTEKLQKKKVFFNVVGIVKLFSGLNVGQSLFICTCQRKVDGLYSVNRYVIEIVILEESKVLIRFVNRILNGPKYTLFKGALVASLRKKTHSICCAGQDQYMKMNQKQVSEKKNEKSFHVFLYFLFLFYSHYLFFYFFLFLVLSDVQFVSRK